MASKNCISYTIRELGARACIYKTNKTRFRPQITNGFNKQFILYFIPLESQRRKYFKSVAKALIDFQELNPTSPVHMLVDNLNTKKTLPIDTLPTWLRNLAEYLQCVPMDAGIGTSIWSQVVQGIETLFRRIILSLNTLEEPTYLLDIMVCVLKIPGVSKVRFF